MNQLTIAIDGPASSGKSTVAKIIAKKLGLVYIDTGAMYRVIAYEAFANKIDINDAEKIHELAKNTVITFKIENEQQSVYSNGKDVTDVIRHPEATNSVSQVAAYADVRRELVSQQRKMAESNGVVMDGRDIGTVVLPHADVKIFLVASVEERAMRRFEENKANGVDTPLDQLTKEIELRDYKDSTRESSPLKQAEDAYLVDTTQKDIPKVVEEIVRIIENNTKNSIDRK